MPFHLEPTSQLPNLWNLYTQLTFFYPNPSPSPSSSSTATTPEHITTTLTRGLKTLSTTFPWLAGQVTRSPQPPDLFVVTPSSQPYPSLTLKDCTKTLPSYAAYKDARFPMSWLGEGDVAGRRTQGGGGTEEVGKPVLVVQVTVIEGGVLLTFAGEHSVLDVVGIGMVVGLLGKACKGMGFSVEEVEVGMMERRGVVGVLREGEERRGREEVDREVGGKGEGEGKGKGKGKGEVLMKARPTVTKNIWANFSFAATALKDLKVAAMSSGVISTGFVSTDDALSAFIWVCITRARSCDCESTDTTTFARTVDVRRHLGVSPIYPGNLATKTYTTYTFQELLDTPLGTIAAELRRGVDPKTSDLAYDMRAAAAALSRPAKEGEKPARRSRDLSRDVALSSWAKLDYCFDLDFNLGLGKPEAVRRPAFAPPGEQPMEGLVYLLPKCPDGEVVVAICLREEDMERLKVDRQWAEYASYIG